MVSRLDKENCTEENVEEDQNLYSTMLLRAK